MDNIAKIRVKVGEHEFEAEGPSETVQAQFEAFKELIRATPASPRPSNGQSTAVPPVNQQVSQSGPHIDLQKILHMAGRVISLTALPPSTEDSALLIMLGHKDLRNNVSVTGQEIGDGLAQSGRPVQRVDRLLDKAISDALILKTGVKRSTRYRLTNQGLTKALGIARELIATVP